MCLGHTVGNNVTRAYERGDLLEERRELMDAWGRYALDRQDASGRCSHSGETHNVSGRERYD